MTVETYTTKEWYTFPASDKPDTIVVEDYLRFSAERGLTNLGTHLAPREVNCPYHGKINTKREAIFRSCCALPTVKGEHNCTENSDKCWVFAICGLCAIVDERRTPVYAINAPVDL